MEFEKIEVKVEDMGKEEEAKYGPPELENIAIKKTKKAKKPVFKGSKAASIKWWAIHGKSNIRQKVGKTSRRKRMKFPKNRIYYRKQ